MNRTRGGSEGEEQRASKEEREKEGRELGEQILFDNQPDTVGDSGGANRFERWVSDQGLATLALSLALSHSHTLS